MVNRRKVALVGGALIAAFALVWLLLPEAPAQASTPALETRTTPAEDAACLAGASSLTDRALAQVPVDATLPSTDAVCQGLERASTLAGTVQELVGETGLATR